MREGIVSSVITPLLLVILICSLSLMAQKELMGDGPHHHKYRLVYLDTLGGPTSGVDCCGRIQPTLNNRGTVVGGADTSMTNPNFGISNPLIPPDPFVNVAVAWRSHHVKSLGALPGGYNSFANAVTSNGIGVGAAETNEIDPWLGVVEVHPTLWENGQAIDLGSFGGGEGLALEANNRGLVVGFAQNAIPDPFGLFGFATQSRAFLWQNGVIHDLGTLGGNDAGASFVNDRGQIAGAAFTNITPNPVADECGNFQIQVPTQDPFFWEKGRMIDLGTLGGTCGTATALNNIGQVAGTSDLAGDLTSHGFVWDLRHGMKDLGTLGGTFSQADDLTDTGVIVGAATLQGDVAFHAFLWRQGVMTDLGVLPGDCDSGAYSINSRNQIVGDSFACDLSVTHPFLWDNGAIVALPITAPPGSKLILSEPSAINDRCEIDGYALLDTGPRAFVLIPCGEDQAEGCEDSASSDRATSQSTNSRAAMKPALNPETILGALRNRRVRLQNRF